MIAAYGYISPKIIGGYGRLYNWPVTQLAGFSSIVDFDLPTTAQTFILQTSIGGGPVGGGKLKITGERYWSLGNVGATNNYAFSLLGSGQRESDGTFNKLLETAYLWTTDEYNSLYAHTHKAYGDSASYTFESFSLKKQGHGVRLIYTGGGTPASTVTDKDGNVYNVIQIGTQYWLSENYACTQLNNGTPIPNITDNAAWAADTSGAFCNYKNNKNYVFI